MLERHVGPGGLEPGPGGGPGTERPVRTGLWRETKGFLGRTAAGKQIL